MRDVGGVERERERGVCLLVRRGLRMLRRVRRQGGERERERERERRGMKVREGEWRKKKKKKRRRKRK